MRRGPTALASYDALGPRWHILARGLRPRAIHMPYLPPRGRDRPAAPSNHDQKVRTQGSPTGKQASRGGTLPGQSSLAGCAGTLPTTTRAEPTNLEAGAYRYAPATAAPPTPRGARHCKQHTHSPSKHAAAQERKGKRQGRRHVNDQAIATPPHTDTTAISCHVIDRPRSQAPPSSAPSLPPSFFFTNHSLEEAVRQARG